MKNLGYKNGWPIVWVDANGNDTEDRKQAKTFRNIEPPEYTKCIALGHGKDGTIKARDTFQGDHTRECPICQIKWGWDSGD